MANVCTKCKYFTAYYSRTFIGFYMEKFGYCSIYEKLKDKHEVCEKYSQKVYNQKLKTSMVIDAISNAITNLDTIKNVLEEHRLDKWK